MNRTETCPKRRSQQRQSCRGSDHGEFRQAQPDRAGAWTLADGEVQGKFLHRRVEDLFDRPPQPVDLVDKQDVYRLKVGEDRGQVTRALNRRAGGDL